MILLYFTRVPLLFIRVHLCSFVFWLVWSFRSDPLADKLFVFDPFVVIIVNPNGAAFCGGIKLQLRLKDQLTGICMSNYWNVLQWNSDSRTVIKKISWRVFWHMNLLYYLYLLQFIAIILRHAQFYIC
jgi:hypothetical protein